MAEISSTSVQWSGKISPSGRITVGYVPPKRQRVDDIRYEASRGHYSYSLRCHWHYLHKLVKEVVTRVDKPEDLGLSIAPNHRISERGRYGLRGMTANGRNRVYDGAYLLHRAYPGRLGFYTLTCPYTDEESIYLYNQNISYIVRSYFEELKRIYNRLQVPFSYVSVLEYQDTRYERDGCPVLHVHYVAPCFHPGGRTFVVDADEIRLLWGRVLRRVLGTSVPLGASIDAQVVKTSAANYLAKYLSKGGRTVAYLASVCPDQVPRQWWSMSSNVRRCIKDNTILLSETVCRQLVYNVDSLIQDGFTFVYKQDIYIGDESNQRMCGFYGQLDRSGMAAVRPRSTYILTHFYTLPKSKLRLTDTLRQGDNNIADCKMSGR